MAFISPTLKHPSINYFWSTLDCLNVTLQQLLLVNGGKRSKTGRRKKISKNKGDDVKKTSKKHEHDDDDEDDVLWRETVWSLKFRQTSPHPEIVSESTTSTPLSDLSPFLQPPARETNSLQRRTNQKGDEKNSSNEPPHPRHKSYFILSGWLPCWVDIDTYRYQLYIALHYVQCPVWYVMILQLSLPMPVHEISANSPAQHDLKEERVAGRMLKITRGILCSLILIADISNMVKTLGLSQVSSTWESSHILPGCKAGLHEPLRHFLFNIIHVCFNPVTPQSPFILKIISSTWVVKHSFNKRSKYKYKLNVNLIPRNQHQQEKKE